MKRIVVIGSGNVAEGLALGFVRAGHRPVQVWARSRTAGEALAARCGCAFADDPAGLAPADLYLLAVSDRAIASVSSSFDFGGGVVAHTAGGIPIDALSPEIRHRAVFYPLQTFTKGREISLADTPFLIEGETTQALDTVREAAAELSSLVAEVSSEQRARVHLAAVFASNFANFMYTVGEEILTDAGLPFDLIKPLIRETAAKAVESGSPRTVQTGPAVRNDFETKCRHVELLSERPELKTMYINLSNHIWEISKKK